MKILVINGPNLNMLGIREPGLYGRETYEDLVEKIRRHAEKTGTEVHFCQSTTRGIWWTRSREPTGFRTGSS